MLGNAGKAQPMAARPHRPCPAEFPGEGQLAGGTQETQSSVQKQESAAPVFLWVFLCVLPPMPLVYFPLSTPVQSSRLCCTPWSFLSLQQHFQNNEVIYSFLFYSIFPDSSRSHEPDRKACQRLQKAEERGMFLQ